MTSFVLLHGGMHDGSSWDLVAMDLRSRGHRVVAPDLPVDDDSAGARELARCAIDALDGADFDGDVVAVGHSLAGLVLPVLAAERPVRRMVFLAALLPVVGETFADHMAQNPDVITFTAETSDDGGPFGLSWESVRNGFYHDCPESLARKAFDRLRGQSFTIFTETCPLDRWPHVASTYILMADDRVHGREWALRRAAATPGMTVHEMSGGHSPFLARPQQLCDVLTACSDD